MPSRAVTKYRVHIIFLWLFGLFCGILFSQYSKVILKEFASHDIFVKPSILGLIISAFFPVVLAHFLLIKRQYKLLSVALFFNAFIHGYAVYFYTNICHLGSSVFSSLFLISQNASVAFVLWISLQRRDIQRGIIQTTIASVAVVMIDYLSGYIF